MSIKKNQRLIKKQQKIKQEYDHWESMQMDYSRDSDFYTFCQWKMNLLDEEADQIRWTLEGVR